MNVIKEHFKVQLENPDAQDLTEEQIVLLGNKRGLYSDIVAGDRILYFTDASTSGRIELKRVLVRELERFNEDYELVSSGKIPRFRLR